MEKFWKQVFVASISSGSSVEISAKKADKAIDLLEKRKEGKVEEKKITLSTPLVELLPAGVVNCLKSEDIRTLEDLDGVVLRKLLNIRNFGEGSLKHVAELVESYNRMAVSTHVPLKLKNKRNERVQSSGSSKD
jgi:DNA-directed RNA polymerase alpha subunit